MSSLGIENPNLNKLASNLTLPFKPWMHWHVVGIKKDALVFHQVSPMHPKLARANFRKDKSLNFNCFSSSIAAVTKEKSKI